jgi:hypothetical protein
MLRNLNEIRGLQDPVKQSQCEFIIANVPGLALARTTQKIAGKLSGNTKTVDAKTLRLRATSFSYPGAKIAQTTLILGGHRRKLGTIQDKSGVWKCKITEDFEGGVLNTIAAWCDLIHSNFAGTRLPSVAYTGICTILLGGDNSGGKVNANLKGRQIVLHGFYPISYTVNDIDPNSSNPIDVDISWNYDWWAERGYSLFSIFS